MEQPKQRRILHFSDGVLELDNEEMKQRNFELQSNGILQDSPVDPQKLPWGTWLWYLSTLVGSKTLTACDYAGETLADFFGITSPKYYSEIEAAKEMIQEEELAAREKDIELATWTGSKIGESPVTTAVIQTQSDVPVRHDDISVEVYKFSESEKLFDGPDVENSPKFDVVVL